MINNPSVTIYSIYCITNLVNQKKYIGFTSKFLPEKRFKEHCKNYQTTNTIISKAIQKYGKENFTFEVILQGLDRNDVLSMETYFINEYNTFGLNGYNMTTGGEHWILNDKIKHKMSNSKIGENNPMYGKFGKDSPNYGRKNTKEIKNKMSNSKIGENNPMYGKFGKDCITSKKYLLQFPNGEIKEIIGIGNFCKNINICRNMLRIYSKKNEFYKDYKIIYNS